MGRARSPRLEPCPPPPPPLGPWECCVFSFFCSSSLFVWGSFCVSFTCCSIISESAEWPSGSSFGNSRQVPLGFTRERHTLALLFVSAKGFAVPRRSGGRRCSVGRRGVLGPVPQSYFLQPYSNIPKPDLLQLSLPQSGHRHLLHCALGLGSFGIS